MKKSNFHSSFTDWKKINPPILIVKFPDMFPETKTDCPDEITCLLRCVYYLIVSSTIPLISFMSVRDSVIRGSQNIYNSGGMSPRGGLTLISILNFATLCAFPCSTYGNSARRVLQTDEECNPIPTLLVVLV